MEVRVFHPFSFPATAKKWAVLNHLNRSSVRVNLIDARRKSIEDEVVIKLYNERAESLNQRIKLRMNGRAVTLHEIPAFPFGLHEAIIHPSRYRHKTVFVDVPAGKQGLIHEAFFLDSDRAIPAFPDFSAIQSEPCWADLWRVLRRSGMSSTAAWDALDHRQKAGLFNLHAKMQSEKTRDNRPIFGFLEQVTRFLPARIFAIVDGRLLALLREDSQQYRPAYGALHEFPSGWRRIEREGSFKTPDRAGNLQLTFAEDRSGEFQQEGKLMVDADIDDHRGIQHAADILKHKITGRDTDPYDIHQILTYFQSLDPGYRLI